MRAGLGFLAYVRRRMEARNAVDHLITLGAGMFIGALISFGTMFLTRAFR